MLRPRALRPTRRGFLAALLLLPLLAAWPAGGPAVQAAPAAQVTDKLVLAFYYMWYGPASFSGGQMVDVPATPYISDHPDVVERQVQQAKTAGIDAFISSWQGSGTETDRNFQLLLNTAQKSGFKAALYFETNFALQKGDVVSQLRIALGQYMGQPAYLRAGGKPVVFFWAPGALGDVNAWKNVRDQIDPSHSQIWSVDTTDASYLDVFDSIHLFSGGKWNATTNVSQVDAQWRGIINTYNRAHNTQRIWAAGVIPGWDESRVQPPRRDAKVFPRRDGALYEENWKAALANSADWVTITSFNEWFEGTQIEPSAAYGNKYLDLTQKYAYQWKGTVVNLPPTPVPPAATPVPPASPPPPAGDICSGGTAFAQTGHSICRPMEAYWRQYGGLAQFGYPISDPVNEVNSVDGKSYMVQYFERARFELHPENRPPYDVLLGLVGRQFHAPDPAVAQQAGLTFFAQTGHNVHPTFAAYWQAHGGLFVNGYPISEPVTETLGDGKPYLVQYFERARFELHNENAPPYNVLLGFLGRQAWDTRSH
jgi:hypothetical protein